MSSLCAAGVSRSPSPTSTSTSRPRSVASASRLSCVENVGRKSEITSSRVEAIMSAVNRTSAAGTGEA